MARTILRVPLTDTGGADDFIEVEVELRDVGESVRLASADGSAAAAASFSLASSFSRVVPALSSIITDLRTMPHAPDEVAMEVGLTIGGETGLIFTKGSAEATFTVNLTWRKPPPPPR